MRMAGWFPIATVALVLAACGGGGGGDGTPPLTQPPATGTEPPVAAQVRVIDADTVDIDNFARPDVDVAFTGLADAHGRSRADLRWEDVPVSQGSFQARDADGTIEGRFYGRDHYEVGGIFERDQLTRAFGASR